VVFAGTIPEVTIEIRHGPKAFNVVELFREQFQTEDVDRDVVEDHLASATNKLRPWSDNLR
jgi:hypothetical protein